MWIDCRVLVLFGWLAACCSSAGGGSMVVLSGVLDAETEVTDFFVLFCRLVVCSFERMTTRTNLCHTNHIVLAQVPSTRGRTPKTCTWRAVAATGIHRICAQLLTASCAATSTHGRRVDRLGPSQLSRRLPAPVAADRCVKLCGMPVEAGRQELRCARCIVFAPVRVRTDAHEWFARTDK